MLKKLLIPAVLFLSALDTQAQEIKQIQAYFRPEGTRYVGLLSDNSIWWFAQGKNWTALPKAGLPEKKIHFIDAYLKTGLGTWSARVVCVLEDNSVWWYANDETWEQVSDEGLPAGKNITDIKAYVKTGAMGISDSRIAVVLDDNSIWWTSGKEWKEVSQKGIPEQLAIRFLRSYQKMGMMGSSETRYVASMSDNSLRWFADGGKWQTIPMNGLPGGKSILQMDIYMKTSMGGMQEGRIVAAMEDQSMWWFAANNGKSWNKLSNQGLPEGYEIQAMKAYQKYAGLTQETRIIVLLKDGSLWWYADGKRWTPVPLTGLPRN